MYSIWFYQIRNIAEQNPERLDSLTPEELCGRTDLKKCHLNETELFNHTAARCLEYSESLPVRTVY